MSVAVVCSTLPDVYVEKLLTFVGATLENSRHLQFYLTWAQSLLTIHGQKLKNRYLHMSTHTHKQTRTLPDTQVLKHALVHSSIPGQTHKEANTPCCSIQVLVRSMCLYGAAVSLVCVCVMCCAGQEPFFPPSSPYRRASRGTTKISPSCKSRIHTDVDRINCVGC